MLRFQGKIAAVTGAASGIGAACAEILDAEGATVICADVRASEAAVLATRLERAVSVEVDVTRRETLVDLNAVVARYGRLDILVNSAGVFEVAAPEDTSEALWHHHLAVNLTGTFLCAQMLLSALKDARGAIVNLASVAGLVAFRANAAYSASKGGVIALTRALALDYAPYGVRVNCVCPYSVDGPMMDRYCEAQGDPQGSRAALASATPLRRLGTVREVAEAVAYLASEAAGYTTGVALPVDGGYTAI